MTRLVWEQVADPVTTQQIVGMITGIEEETIFPLLASIEETTDHGIRTLKENKPYTGSFSPSGTPANTGKPR